MTIRIAERKDSKNIAKVHFDSRIAEVQSFKIQIEKYISLKEFERYWKIHLIKPKNETFVYTVANEILGFITFGKYDQRNETSIKNGAAIFALYVSPMHIKSGVGYKIISKAIEKMKNKTFEEVFVWVLSENNRAISFYEKFGFIKENKKRIQKIGNVQVYETRYRMDLKA